MKFTDNIRKWLNGVLRIFFPLTCEVCGEKLVDGENLMCLQCAMAMPRVNFHLNPEHELWKRLSSAAKINRLASYFYYKKDNSYSQLIRRSKYNSHPEIDYTLALRFATELLPLHFFDGIDVIIPVPMHYWKQLRRGFNQTHEIARGISEITGIEIMYNLVATKGHKTQTRRGAAQRITNSKGIYQLINPEELEGKHILIVDDVITTGATIISCAEAIHSAFEANNRDNKPLVPPTISVLSLAATKFDN